ncbi:MAG: antibiotic biosynthesis monooxygenase [Leptospiraceae bacterium]|nr:antibiotic biosynthesis monooxygenase [Leptospiraceae bacterium]
MITEIAILKIKDQQNKEFEVNFAKAEKIISQMKGYISHELLKCMEAQNQYLLLVRWETLEDHTIGFRKSEEYLEWKKLLHHFYDPFPTVEHYSEIKFEL